MDTTVILGILVSVIVITGTNCTQLTSGEVAVDIIKVKTTNAGQLVGRKVTLSDGKTQILEFHNIRYAKAPVGTLSSCIRQHTNKVYSSGFWRGRRRLFGVDSSDRRFDSLCTTCYRLDPLRSLS